MRKAITKEQVQRLHDNHVRVKLIDIRSTAEHEKLHIPGALNIPSENLSKQLETFSKDETIVCICNHGKDRSQQAADLFSNAGFKNTYYLERGTAGWYL